MSARLEVVAKPGARASQILRRNNVVVVAVRERATDGKANGAIVSAVARWLDVPPSRITIAFGEHGRRKILRIEGIDDMYVRARVDALPNADVDRD